MTWLLSIDPGAKSGFALFTDGVLSAVRVLKPTDFWEHVTPDIVVIEAPDRVFGQARQRDIMKLSRIAGRYEERFRHAEVQRLVAPRDWKGTIDGDIMTARILAACDPGERALLAKVKDDHNAVDAVGMGKWSLRQPWYRALTR